MFLIHTNNSLVKHFVAINVCYAFIDLLPKISNFIFPFVRKRNDFIVRERESGGKGESMKSKKEKEAARMKRTTKEKDESAHRRACYEETLPRCRTS